MKRRSILTAILFIVISLSLSNSYAQQFKINEDIGGGGTSGNSIKDNSDNTTLYLVGGAVVVGIIVYAVLKDKKEQPKKDTTSVVPDNDTLKKRLALDDYKLKSQTEIPVNISFGMQNNLLMQDEKRYFIGVAYKF